MWTTFSTPSNFTVPPAISGFLRNRTANTPNPAWQKQQVNERHQEAPVPPHTQGSPGFLGRGTGVCRPPVGRASKPPKPGERCEGEGTEKVRGRQIGEGRGVGMKKSKAEKRQLKRKHADAISASGTNKVSSVSLSRVTKTSSHSACASASTVTLLAASTAHTLRFQKPQGNLSITLIRR